MDSIFSSSTDDVLDADATKLLETWVETGMNDILEPERHPSGETKVVPYPSASFDVLQASTPVPPSDSSPMSLVSEQSAPGSTPTLPAQQQQDLLSTSISISPVFIANNSDSTTRPPVDMVIMSSDNMVFYVDEYTLFNVSNNRFNGLLPLSTTNKQQRILFLREIISSEMQVFLQSIYNVASVEVPDLGTLTRGIAWLAKYGFEAKNRIQPETCVFDYLLSHAPIQPLDVYACAAMHDIYALAVQVSPYMLRIGPHEVTEEMAVRIGSKYLRKYFELHSRRTEVLKGLLMKEPDLHNVTRDCDFERQRKSISHWNQGVAQLSFILKADTTTTAIRDTLLQATEDIGCPECLRARDTRLNTVLREWSMASVSTLNDLSLSLPLLFKLTIPFEANHMKLENQVFLPEWRVVHRPTCR
uniref:BTB domain-containing protein n=1 Tax=Moniliophthora roreri TaxID=221103 RepID=A0A0W0FT36_MONRR